MEYKHYWLIIGAHALFLSSLVHHTVSITTGPLIEIPIIKEKTENFYRIFYKIFLNLKLRHSFSRKSNENECSLTFSLSENNSKARINSSNHELVFRCRKWWPSQTMNYVLGCNSKHKFIFCSIQFSIKKNNVLIIANINFSL